MGAGLRKVSPGFWGGGWGGGGLNKGVPLIVKVPRLSLSIRYRVGIVVNTIPRCVGYQYDTALLS